MSDDQALANSIDKRFEKIHQLLDEVIECHARMQELLSEAIIKAQTDRGVHDIECFLNPDKK